jgi:acetyl/propionyl-CoA carboxylase alpha subunit
MICRLLVDRGEIAVRVIRTCCDADLNPVKLLHDGIWVVDALLVEDGPEEEP